MSDRALIYKHTINMTDDNSAISLVCRMVAGKNPCVLDVGCACGDLGVALKATVKARMYGLEINKGAIAMARQTKAYRRICHVDLDVLKADRYPDWAGKFDYVVCADVLEHLRDPMATLSELRRFLRPTGHVIASIPNVAHMSVKANLLVNDFTYMPVGLLDCTHIHLFTHKSIAEGMAKIGLRIDKCRFTMHHKNAWQPNDPYPELSKPVKRQIFKDWHSYVCQYVLLLSSSNLSAESLALMNASKVRITGRNAPFKVKAYRRKLLKDLTE